MADLSDQQLDATELPWYRGPAFQLLVVLVSVYAVGTFIGSHGYGTYLINALLMASLFLGVRKITRSQKALRVTLVIFLIGFIGEKVGTKILGREVIVWDYWINMIFFGAVLSFLIFAVVKAKQVDADTVFAASSVFMLMGIVWAYAFMLVHAADPAAFSLSPHDMTQPASALLHFSFTTLTTVGYGSISPMSDMARTLSDLEALIAQLYLAVVVARLVSLQIEHSRKNGED
ncbi:MAG: potassium channel family protein [Thermoanaerobaculia bacterium]